MKHISSSIIADKHHFRHRLAPNTTGFSILEAVVVVAIMSILAAISMPTLWRWVALSRIDAAKTVLNSAASECLQSFREGKLPSEASPKDTTISNDLLMGHGYQIKQNQSTCADFKIVPKQQDEKFLFEMGFSVTSEGEIYKIAIPAYDPGSLDSCKNWAGVGCTVSKELQDRIKAGELLALQLRTCNESFQKNQQDKATGPFMKWNSTTNSCTLEQLLYEGIPCKDQDDCGRLRKEKIGLICDAKLKEKEAAKFDGLYKDPECPTTYFCSGKDLATDNLTAYNACKEQERQTKCTSDLAEWKKSGPNGMFTSSGCTSMWKCDEAIYSSKANYDSSSCACTETTETYISGTIKETYISGYQQQATSCKTWGPGYCLQWNYTQVAVYATRDVPQYATRTVCK